MPHVGKHVVISPEGGDWTIDMTFAGLVRKLGAENVIDWPPRPKHRERPKYCGDPEADWGAERRSMGFTPEYEGAREWTRAELVAEIVCGGMDRIFVDETLAGLEHHRFITSMATSKPKVVVVAGNDNFRGHPVDVVARYGAEYEAMFSDDFLFDMSGISNCHLINYSCNFDHLWERKRHEKVYDICFMGYNSNPVRKQVIDHIKKKWGHLNNCIIFEERSNSFDKFVSHADMFDNIAKSKICLNLHGDAVNRKALRYYQIPHVGSFMLSHRLPGRTLDRFVGGKHCAYFDSLDDLDRWIEFYLKNKDVREKIADSGNVWCTAFHTVDARMDYIFGVLNG